MKNFRNLSVGTMLLLAVIMQFSTVNADASCVNRNDDLYCREDLAGATRCYFEGSSTDGCCTKQAGLEEAD